MQRQYSEGLRDRVLFWVGLGMCGLSIAVIAVAEAFMPDNVHGRQGVITFYRTHGVGLLVWASIVAWTVGRRQGSRQATNRADEHAGASRPDRAAFESA